MKHNVRLVVLTGAHGTGKSYIAKKLVTELKDVVLIDNIGCKWTRPYFLLQLFITTRYFLRILWYVCIRRKVAVVTRGYIDQSYYALATGCLYLGYILKWLARVQGSDPKVIFLHFPITPQLEALAVKDIKWRPCGSIACFVADGIKAYLSTVRVPVVSVPADISQRNTYLPFITEFIACQIH